MSSSPAGRTSAAGTFFAGRERHIMWFRSPGARARKGRAGMRHGVRKGPEARPNAYERQRGARADRVPLIRVMGARHGVRKWPEADKWLTRGAPDAGSTREVPGTCGGDREWSLMGRVTAVTRTPPSRKGGVMMRHASRRVYKGTAPRIGAQ